MRSQSLALALAAGLAFSGPLPAHGGHYPAPPPPAPGGGVGGAGGAGGGGGYGGPGDTPPPAPPGAPSGPSTPSGPSPSGPSTPGPSGPGTPRRPGPATPGPGGPATPGGPGSAGAPTTGGGAGSDPADWHTWWDLNRHQFLHLREAILEPSTSTGSDDFDLGRGQRAVRADELKPSAALVAERIAPALRRVLREESQPDLVSSCMTALAKVGETPVAAGEPSARDVLARFLSHPNQELQETAALCLGMLGDSGSPTDLAALLEGGARGRELVGGERVALRTRAFAAYGLGTVARMSERVDLRRYAVHQLARALEERNASNDVAVACVNALAIVELPSSVVRDEKEELPAASSREALLAYLLARLGDDRLDDRVKSHVPRAVARALAPPDDPNAKPAISALLRIVETGRRGDRDVLRGAIQALGDVRAASDEATEQAVRRALLDAAREADALSRPFALIALAQVASRPGASETAAREVRAFLLKTMASGDSRLRPWAGLALGVMGYRLRAQRRDLSRDVDLALRTALSECRVPTDVGAYAIGAGLRGDLGASGWILEKLDGMQDDGARADLAVALGLLGDRACAERLRELLPDSVYRPALMRGLATGLALLRDKSTVPALVKALSESKSHSIQAVYAWTLAHTGDARAVDTLIALLEDHDAPSITRSNAAIGLGFVCERELMPWNAELARDSNYPNCPETLHDGVKGALDIY